MSDDLSRRAVLRGGALFALAGASGFVVARGTDAAKESVTEATDPYGAPAAANAYGAPPAADTAHPLARLDQVPAGGGLVLGKRRVVLTRDAGGAVRGFSALCTHQGCTVAAVRAGVILCPCHGSRYDGTTGAVLGGPAPRPLAKVPVVVRDGTVYTA